MAAHRKTWMVVATLVIVLAGFRLALPWMVEDYVNRTLQEMEDYSGSVEEVDIALWRGAYRIKGLRITKDDAESLEPFFSAPTIDLSVGWRQLANGSLVAEMIFWQPQLNLVEAEAAEESQTGEEVDWQEQFESLFPFSFDRIRVQSGEVRFRTPGIDSEDAISIDGIVGELQNLTNVVESSEDAFATFEFSAHVFQAPLRLQGRVNPIAVSPTFDLNAELEQVSVPELNPWLREYINVDAQAGVFALFVELAAADGRFQGYAKPFSDGIEILDLSDDSKSLLHKAWEAIVDVTASILENPEDEDVATRIPIQGTIDDPEAGTWRAISNALRHAFLGSFSRSLEHSISLDDGGIEVEPEAQENGADEEKEN